MKPEVELILKIELVPGTSWYNNVRSAVDAKTWDVIRRHAYALSNHACGICEAEGRLNCHEVWSYDDKKHIQKLMGFIALCDMCHHVKHIGFAWVLAKQGNLNMADVVKHFVTVNKCTEAVFNKHKDEAFEIWEERSRRTWKVDLRYLDDVEMGVQNGN